MLRKPEFTNSKELFELLSPLFPPGAIIPLNNDEQINLRFNSAGDPTIGIVFSDPIYALAAKDTFGWYRVRGPSYELQINEEFIQRLKNPDNFEKLKKDIQSNIEKEKLSEKNYQEGVAFYKQGVQAEDLQDDLTARKHYEEAAKLGITQAKVKLAEFHIQNRGGLNDEKVAYELLDDALKHTDSRKAMKLMADLLVKRNDNSKDLWWARYYYNELNENTNKRNESAIQGIKQTDNMLCEQAVKECTSTNPAEELYKKAREMEKMDMYEYRTGYYYKQLEIQKRLYYQAAAQLGHAGAKISLALSYLKSEGGLQYDPKIAFNLMQEAAQEKNPIAIFNLGVMYEKGEGVNQDLNEAKKLFESLPDDKHAQKKLESINKLIAKNEANAILSSQIESLLQSSRPIEIEITEILRSSKTQDVIYIRAHPENSEAIYKLFKNFGVIEHRGNFFEIPVTEELRKKIENDHKDMLSMPKEEQKEVETKQTKKDESIVTEHRTWSEKPVEYTQEEKIKSISSVLNDWEVTPNKDTGSQADTQFKVTKKDASFTIQKNSFKTHDPEIGTFLAMLKAFKAVHPNGKLPRIATKDKDSKALWVEALKIVYHGINADFDSMITVKNKEQRPISLETKTHRPQQQ